MADIKNIISGLKTDFENNDSVVALILVGSHARETIYRAEKYSDLEIYIVVKDESVKEVGQKLPNLVKKFGKVLFSFNHAIGFVTTYEDLFRLEISIVKQSNIDSVFSRPKQQNIKIIFDKTSGILDEVLEKRPEKINYEEFFQDKVVNFWYWQILGVQYFLKGEIYNAKAVLGINSSIIIKLFEFLNDPEILLLETNKRIEKFLTNEQLEILEQTSPSYKDEDIKESLIRIMNIFPNILKEIKTKYKYTYDESLEGKIKPRLLEIL